MAIRACLALLSLGSSTAVGQAPPGPDGMAQGRMMQMMGIKQQMGGMLKLMSGMMLSGQIDPARMKQLPQMTRRLLGDAGCCVVRSRAGWPHERYRGSRTDASSLKTASHAMADA